MDQIIDINIYNYNRIYGYGEIKDGKEKKRFEKYFLKTIKNCEDILKSLDNCKIENCLISSELLIPTFINNEKTNKMNRELSTIECTLDDFNRNYFYKEMDAYDYKIAHGVINWYDKDNIIICTAKCIPVCVLTKMVQEMEFEDTIFKYLKLLWSWRQNYIDECEEIPLKRSMLKEIKKIKKIVHSYKNPKLMYSGLLYTNLLENYMELSVNHAMTYTTWIQKQMNYSHCLCPNDTFDENMTYTFYIIRDIEKV
jgi:hypothetical protein